MRWLTPRRRLLAYLVFVHVLLAAVAGLVLRDRREWIVAAELVFAASLGLGVWLAGGVLRPLGLLKDGAQLLAERDFTTRFREVGQPEADELVRVYNRMSEHLREERLRVQEQHHFLVQVLEASPSGIVTLDFDGQVDFVNRAAEALLATPAADLRNRTLAAAASPLATALASLEEGESRVVSAPGGRRVRALRGHFVDRGFPRRFYLLEELTRELRRHERAAYEKLVRMLSHEVNNALGAAHSLLHSCLAYAPQLREDDRRDFERAIGVVIGRTEQLGAFMKSFTDVVRLPAPARRSWDVVEVLQGIADLLAGERERRRVAWRWVVEEKVAPLSFDRGQMERVFLNVAKNALEAIVEDGTVTVRVGRRGPRAYVAFEDTGPGLSAEAQAHLFTPFFSTKEHGQGIGLTLVQEVLAAHGFEYALESPPGGPTRFTIVL